jgi:hypothetical protein
MRLSHLKLAEISNRMKILYLLIVVVPDTKSNFNCNQSRFCKITPYITKLINKYKNDFYFYGRRQGNGCEIQNNYGNSIDVQILI